jgi:HlyD family secretion protein
MRGLLDALKSLPADSADDYGSTLPWIRFGYRILAGLVAGILLFSFVSISGAVVTSGVVNVETNYKTVQHLDGGIVAKILVRNGDRVLKDRVLLRLDDTQIKASHAIALAKMQDLLVQQARLEAERDGRQTMDLPPGVRSSTDPALAKVIAAQQALLDARLAAHRGEQDVLRQRVEQTSNDMAGISRILEARRREAAISASELASLKPLYERGFANQQRFFPVQRENARLEGEIGKLMSDYARAQAAHSEAQLRLAQSAKEYMHNITDELRKVQAQLAEVVEQRTALEDRLRRTEIRAPYTGHVHNMSVHTEGGVIAPGSSILQIIPEGERLLIDAQILPQDIDKVRKGQPAYVRFPAFNAKSTPRLEGVVQNVSAAQVTDNQSRSFFTVQIALAEGEIAKLPKGHSLVPGMPAEVYLETGNRSIMSYFMKPLLDALSRTFRES